MLNSAADLPLWGSLDRDRSLAGSFEQDSICYAVLYRHERKPLSGSCKSLFVIFLNVPHCRPMVNRNRPAQARLSQVIPSRGKGLPLSDLGTVSLVFGSVVKLCR
jgi:hypothetical protein